MAQREMQSHRPTGVTILAVLNIIGGVILLILGGLLILAASVIPNLSSFDESAARQLEEQLRPTGLPVEVLGPILSAIGGVMLALGIASIVVAMGLLKGKGWAWTITMILSFIGIAVAVASIAFRDFGGIASLIINGIVLYYLFRPNVKAYFGRVKSQPQPMA